MLITHDMGVIAAAAHRVAVMYAGRIVEIGPVQTLSNILATLIHGASWARSRKWVGATNGLPQIDGLDAAARRHSNRLRFCASLPAGHANLP